MRLRSYFQESGDKLPRSKVIMTAKQVERSLAQS